MFADAGPSAGCTTRARSSPGFFPEDVPRLTSTPTSASSASRPPRPAATTPSRVVATWPSCSTTTTTTEEVMKVLSRDRHRRRGRAAAARSSRPHKDFDGRLYPNEIDRSVADVAYDATAFLFDGSDAMPGEVGAGTLLEGDDVLDRGPGGPRHRAEEHRRELAVELTRTIRSAYGTGVRVRRSHAHRPGPRRTRHRSLSEDRAVPSTGERKEIRHARARPCPLCSPCSPASARALALYWLLNKIAELLPAKWESTVKPYFYILPAYLAIIVYLLYPAIYAIIDSFKDRTGTRVGRHSRTTPSCSSRTPASADTCSTRCCGSSSSRR